MQIVFNKLFNKRSTPVKQALKSKREVKLSEINTLREAFNVDGKAEIEAILEKLDYKLQEATTQANELIDLGSMLPEFYDEAQSLSDQTEELLGEVPVELSNLINEIEEYYQKVSDLGHEYDSEITSLWDNLPKYI